MRTLATIQRVLSVEPIPNADKIELARVLGWQTVIKKGEYRPEDLITYVEIDSVLPDRPEYEFMRERKFRVRTARFRGCYSQGLILPPVPGCQEGTDVTERLGIVKYEPKEVDDSAELVVKPGRWTKPFMRFSLFRKLYFWFNRKDDTKWPEWLPKTDETRVQVLGRLLEDPSLEGKQFYVTEKLDGTSATYAMIGMRRWYGLVRPTFVAFSRNVNVTRQKGCLYLRVAEKHELRKHLLWAYYLYGDNAVQGEIVGPRVQGNKYGLTELVFRPFQIRSKREGLAPLGRFQGTCRIFGLEPVPVLCEAFDLVGWTVDMLVKYATRKSTLADTLAEGVVIRSNDMKVSFKVINPEFLVKHDC